MMPEDRTLRARLGEEPFLYGAELVTTRGVPEPAQRAALREMGEALAGDPRIGWLSITDNPGGHPMLPADWLANVLKPLGKPLVVHLTCKDLNRNALESAAWRYAADGFDNLLALTGDYPAGGYRGRALPVFDLDSVSLIALLQALNRGLETLRPDGRTAARLAPTRFFIGCTVSPFKRHERELMPQYFKLARKIRVGADWVIPQLGYDMRKFHEVKLFLDWANLSRPIVGNVYVLNRAAARLFHENRMPGCVVTDELCGLIERYSAGPDKGRAFFIELAARQLAVFKGMGFAAGYLGGVHEPEAFGEIIDRAESYDGDAWRAFAKDIQHAAPGEFYLFERDEATGLGDPSRMNRDYLASLERPRRPADAGWTYRVSRIVHDLAFTPGARLFPTLQRLYGRLEAGGHRRTLKVLHGVERQSKAWMYGCKDCGDCSLPDVAYLCPRSACSKAGLNGPCGGSADGRCELDDKECVWARAYERLKCYGESRSMLDGPAVFANPALDGTSSWANTFTGRDHYAAGAGPR